jgi:cellulose synthase/poly-beta-1,6-N-acetylglucosamine synthase-like glycosyltransferase
MQSLIVGLLVGLPLLLVFYTYAGYPAVLWLLARVRGRIAPAATPSEWPTISITVPAYNEEAQIRGAVESLLALDYPPELRQILIVSDASTDRTDEIVSEFASWGVELLRVPTRGGKGAAERAAAPYLRGDIVVNTDASIRIQRGALKRLIARFADPTVGLASGRDVSVSRVEEDVNVGESGYVGYEMGIRRLETRLEGIVGASGCFYAIRADLHRKPLPHALSRDFASAMITRENGFRAVSVDDATCLVPRSSSLHREYRRKVRTITRGIKTLAYKRHLLNPLQYGLFAWMLFSHKICRWLVPWATIPAALGCAIAAMSSLWAVGILAAGVVAGCLAGFGWMRAEHGPLPRILAVPAFVAAGNVAALVATLRAFRGAEDSVWEPTRREVVPSPAR